ncbi:MAG: uracil-DNA glycosylase family protein [Muribaculaceae bacterium]|nr:uracil-DNA glycosylase family protein [Muribaculaceae bacterium]MDE6118852.1 uracil-DNA glycosylase family protein [Muribaculaceae bacterium]
MPKGARILIVGTFPPERKRWSVDFYYPNPGNDFWRIMGLLFLDDKNALFDSESGSWCLDRIKALMSDKGIALADTARRVRRLRGNASDKFLEILEPVALDALLAAMPDCRAVVSTGEKAASVIAALTSTDVPGMGGMTVDAAGMEIWRMPSSSRAYPLKLERKAEYYAGLFRHLGIL